MSDYPKRDKFFSHRFCRLLTKTAMAQQIGAGTCWMLTVIAHQEDSKRYTEPVSYWNDQLQSVSGFGSRSTLVKARKKAIESGWLHYEPGGKGKVGKYWVLIPERFEDLPDLPCDENPSDYVSDLGQDKDQEKVCPSESGQDKERESGQDPNLPTENCTANGRQTDGKRTASEHHSTLTLNPIPNPKNTNAQMSLIETIYEAYPKKVGKAKALTAIKVALKKIAFDDLLGAVREYAECRAGPDQQFTPYPATWFNQERWKDDRKEWKSDSGGTGKRRLSAGEKYDPNHKPEF